MLDVGFSELLVIMAIAVFVVGPEEIPRIMVMLGRVARRISYIKYAFSQQFEDFLREADLADIRQRVNFEAAKGAFDEDIDEAEGDVVAQVIDLEPDAEREEQELPGLPAKPAKREASS